MNINSDKHSYGIPLNLNRSLVSHIIGNILDFYATMNEVASNHLKCDNFLSSRVEHVIQFSEEMSGR